MRNSLPNRRHSWTQTVRIEGQRFYATFGEHEDGTLGEVWIDASKDGTFLRGVLGSFARMLSVALQFGTPVTEAVSALRHLNFPPNGGVEGEATQVRVCSSVVDWVAQEIENRYCTERTAESGDSCDRSVSP